MMRPMWSKCFQNHHWPVWEYAGPQLLAGHQRFFLTVTLQTSYSERRLETLPR